MDEPEEVDSVTPYMDVYKAKFQSNGSLDKLNFIIVVKRDLKDK